MERSPSKADSIDDPASFKGQMAARYKERQSMGFHLDRKDDQTETAIQGEDSATTEEAEIENTKDSPIKFPISASANEITENRAIMKDSRTTPSLDPRKSMKDLISQFEKRSLPGSEENIHSEKKENILEQLASVGANEGKGLARQAWRGSNRALHLDLDTAAETSSNSSLSMTEDNARPDSESHESPGGVQRPGQPRRKKKKFPGGLKSASSFNIEVKDTKVPDSGTESIPVLDKGHFGGDAVKFGVNSSYENSSDATESKLNGDVKAIDKSRNSAKRMVVSSSEGDQGLLPSLGSLNPLQQNLHMFETEYKDKDGERVNANDAMAGDLEKKDQDAPQPLRINLKGFATRKKRSSYPSDVKYVVHKKDWKKWMQNHQGPGGVTRQQKQQMTEPLSGKPASPQRQSAVDLRYLQKLSLHQDGPLAESTSTTGGSTGMPQKVFKSMSNTQQRLDQRQHNKPPMSAFNPTNTKIAQSLPLRPDNELRKQGGAMERYLMFLNRTSKAGNQGNSKAVNRRSQSSEPASLTQRPPSTSVLDDRSADNTATHADKLGQTLRVKGGSLPPSPSTRRRSEFPQQALQSFLKQTHDAEKRMGVQRNSLHPETFDAVCPSSESFSNANTMSTSELDKQTERVLARLEEITSSKASKSIAFDTDTTATENKLLNSETFQSSPLQSKTPATQHALKASERLHLAKTMVEELRADSKSAEGKNDATILPSEQHKGRATQSRGMRAATSSSALAERPVPNHSVSPRVHGTRGNNRVVASRSRSSPAPAKTANVSDLKSASPNRLQTKSTEPCLPDKRINSSNGWSRHNSRRQNPPITGRSTGEQSRLLIHTSKDKAALPVKASNEQSPVDQFLVNSEIKDPVTLVHEKTLNDTKEDFDEYYKNLEKCIQKQVSASGASHMWPSINSTAGTSLDPLANDISMRQFNTLDMIRMLRHDVGRWRADENITSEITQNTTVPTAGAPPRSSGRNGGAAQDAQMRSRTDAVSTSKGVNNVGNAARPRSFSSAVSRSKSTHVPNWNRQPPSAMLRLNRAKSPTDVSSHRATQQVVANKKQTNHADNTENVTTRADQPTKSSELSTKPDQPVDRKISRSPSAPSPKRGSPAARRRQQESSTVQTPVSHNKTPDAIPSTTSVASRRGKIRADDSQRSRNPSASEQNAGNVRKRAIASTRVSQRKPKGPVTNSTQMAAYDMTTRPSSSTLEACSSIGGQDLVKTQSSKDAEKPEDNQSVALPVPKALPVPTLEDKLDSSPAAASPDKSPLKLQITDGKDNDEVHTVTDSEMDNKLGFHFGSGQHGGDTIEDEEEKKESSPEASPLKRKRKLVDKMKKMRKKKKKRQDDETHTEEVKDLSVALKTTRENSLLREKQAEKHGKSPERVGDSILSRRDISPLSKANKKKKELSFACSVATSRKDSPDCSQTAGVTSVTIRRKSRSRSPPRRCTVTKLPKYRPVKRLSLEPTEMFPITSHIPTRVEGPQFPPFRRRTDVLAQYRRWREQLVDTERPSKLPLSMGFRWTLDSAVVEEWAMHCWEPDSGVYMDEHGAWWSSVTETTPPSCQQTSLLADTWISGDICGADILHSYNNKKSTNPRYSQTVCNGELNERCKHRLELSFNRLDKLDQFELLYLYVCLPLITTETKGYTQPKQPEDSPCHFIKIRVNLFIKILCCPFENKDNFVDPLEEYNCEHLLEQIDTQTSNTTSYDQNNNGSHESDRYNVCKRFTGNTIMSSKMMNQNQTHLPTRKLDGRLHRITSRNYSKMSRASLEGRVEAIISSNLDSFSFNSNTHVTESKSTFYSDSESWASFSSFSNIDRGFNRGLALSASREKNNNSKAYLDSQCDVSVTLNSHTNKPCQDTEVCTANWVKALQSRRTKRNARPRPWKDPVVPADTISHGAISVSAMTAVDKHDTRQHALEKNHRLVAVSSKLKQHPETVDHGGLPEKIQFRNIGKYTRRLQYTGCTSGSAPRYQRCGPSATTTVNKKDLPNEQRFKPKANPPAFSRMPQVHISSSIKPKQTMGPRESECSLVSQIQTTRLNPYSHIKPKVQCRLGPQHKTLRSNKKMCSSQKGSLTHNPERWVNSLIEGNDEVRRGVAKLPWNANNRHLQEQFTKKVEEVVMKRAQAIVKSYQEFLERQVNDNLKSNTHEMSSSNKDTKGCTLDKDFDHTKLGCESPPQENLNWTNDPKLKKSMSPNEQFQLRNSVPNDEKQAIDINGGKSLAACLECTGGEGSPEYSTYNHQSKSRSPGSICWDHTSDKTSDPRQMQLFSPSTSQALENSQASRDSRIHRPRASENKGVDHEYRKHSDIVKTHIVSHNSTHLQRPFDSNANGELNNIASRNIAKGNEHHTSKDLKNVERLEIGSKLANYLKNTHVKTQSIRKETQFEIKKEEMGLEKIGIKMENKTASNKANPDNMNKKVNLNTQPATFTNTPLRKRLKVIKYETPRETFNKSNERPLQGPWWNTSPSNIRQKAKVLEKDKSFGQNKKACLNTGMLEVGKENKSHICHHQSGDGKTAAGTYKDKQEDFYTPLRENICAKLAVESGGLGDKRQLQVSKITNLQTYSLKNSPGSLNKPPMQHLDQQETIIKPGDTRNNADTVSIKNDVDPESDSSSWFSGSDQTNFSAVKCFYLNPPAKNVSKMSKQSTLNRSIVKVKEDENVTGGMFGNIKRCNSQPKTNNTRCHNDPELPRDNYSDGTLYSSSLSTMRSISELPLSPQMELVSSKSPQRRCSRKALDDISLKQCSDEDPRISPRRSPIKERSIPPKPSMSIPVDRLTSSRYSKLQDKSDTVNIADMGRLRCSHKRNSTSNCRIRDKNFSNRVCRASVSEPNLSTELTYTSSFQYDTRKKRSSRNVTSSSSCPSVRRVRSSCTDFYSDVSNVNRPISRSMSKAQSSTCKKRSVFSKTGCNQHKHQDLQQNDKHEQRFDSSVTEFWSELSSVVKHSQKYNRCHNNSPKRDKRCRKQKAARIYYSRLAAQGAYKNSPIFKIGKVSKSFLPQSKDGHKNWDRETPKPHVKRPRTIEDSPVSSQSFPSLLKFWERKASVVARNRLANSPKLRRWLTNTPRFSLIKYSTSGSSAEQTRNFEVMRNFSESQESYLSQVGDQLRLQKTKARRSKTGLHTPKSSRHALNDIVVQSLPLNKRRSRKHTKLELSAEKHYTRKEIFHPARNSRTPITPEKRLPLALDRGDMFTSLPSRDKYIAHEDSLRPLINFRFTNKHSCSSPTSGHTMYHSVESNKHETPLEKFFNSALVPDCANSVETFRRQRIIDFVNKGFIPRKVKPLNSPKSQSGLIQNKRKRKTCTKALSSPFSQRDTLKSISTLYDTEQKINTNLTSPKYTRCHYGVRTSDTSKLHKNKNDITPRARSTRPCEQSQFTKSTKTGVFRNRIPVKLYKPHLEVGTSPTIGAQETYSKHSFEHLGDCSDKSIDHIKVKTHTPKYGIRLRGDVCDTPYHQTTTASTRECPGSAASSTTTGYIISTGLDCTSNSSTTSTPKQPNRSDIFKCTHINGNSLKDSDLLYAEKCHSYAEPAPNFDNSKFGDLRRQNFQNRKLVLSPCNMQSAYTPELKPNTNRSVKGLARTPRTVVLQRTPRPTRLIASPLQQHTLCLHGSAQHTPNHLFASKGYNLSAPHTYVINRTLSKFIEDYDSSSERTHNNEFGKPPHDICSRSSNTTPRQKEFQKLLDDDHNYTPLDQSQHNQQQGSSHSISVHHVDTEFNTSTDLQHLEGDDTSDRYKKTHIAHKTPNISDSSTNSSDSLVQRNVNYRALKGVAFGAKTFGPFKTSRGHTIKGMPGTRKNDTVLVDQEQAIVFRKDLQTRIEQLPFDLNKRGNSRKSSSDTDISQMRKTEFYRDFVNQKITDNSSQENLKNIVKTNTFETILCRADSLLLQGAKHLHGETTRKVVQDHTLGFLEKHAAVQQLTNSKLLNHQTKIVSSCDFLQISPQEKRHGDPTRTVEPSHETPILCDTKVVLPSIELNNASKQTTRLDKTVDEDLNEKDTSLPVSKDASNESGGITKTYTEATNNEQEDKPNYNKPESEHPRIPSGGKSTKSTRIPRDIEIVLGDDVTVHEFMKCFMGGFDFHINSSGSLASTNINGNKLCESLGPNMNFKSCIAQDGVKQKETKTGVQSTDLNESNMGGERLIEGNNNDGNKNMSRKNETLRTTANRPSNGKSCGPESSPEKSGYLKLAWWERSSLERSKQNSPQKLKTKGNKIKCQNRKQIKARSFQQTIRNAESVSYNGANTRSQTVRRRNRIKSPETVFWSSVSPAFSRRKTEGAQESYKKDAVNTRNRTKLFSRGQVKDSLTLWRKSHVVKTYDKQRMRCAKTIKSSRSFDCVYERKVDSSTDIRSCYRSPQPRRSHKWDDIVEHSVKHISARFNDDHLIPRKSTPVLNLYYRGRADSLGQERRCKPQPMTWRKKQYSGQIMSSPVKKKKQKPSKNKKIKRKTLTETLLERESAVGVSTNSACSLLSYIESGDISKAKKYCCKEEISQVAQIDKPGNDCKLKSKDCMRHINNNDTSLYDVEERGHVVTNKGVSIEHVMYSNHKPCDANTRKCTCADKDKHSIRQRNINRTVQCPHNQSKSKQVHKTHAKNIDLTYPHHIVPITNSFNDVDKVSFSQPQKHDRYESDVENRQKSHCCEVMLCRRIAQDLPFNSPIENKYCASCAKIDSCHCEGEMKPKDVVEGKDTCSPNQYENNSEYSLINKEHPIVTYSSTIKWIGMGEHGQEDAVNRPHANPPGHSRAETNEKSIKGHKNSGHCDYGIGQQKHVSVPYYENAELEQSNEDQSKLTNGFRVDAFLECDQRLNMETTGNRTTAIDQRPCGGTEGSSTKGQLPVMIAGDKRSHREGDVKETTAAHDTHVTGLHREGVTAVGDTQDIGRNYKHQEQQCGPSLLEKTSSRAVSISSTATIIPQETHNVALPVPKPRTIKTTGATGIASIKNNDAQLSFKSKRSVSPHWREVSTSSSNRMDEGQCSDNKKDESYSEERELSRTPEDFKDCVQQSKGTISKTPNIDLYSKIDKLNRKQKSAQICSKTSDNTKDIEKLMMNLLAGKIWTNDTDNCGSEQNAVRCTGNKYKSGRTHNKEKSDSTDTEMLPLSKLKTVIEKSVKENIDLYMQRIDKDNKETPTVKSRDLRGLRLFDFSPPTVSSAATLSNNPKIFNNIGTQGGHRVSSQEAPNPSVVLPSPDNQESLVGCHNYRENVISNEICNSDNFTQGQYLNGTEDSTPIIQKANRSIPISILQSQQHQSSFPYSPSSLPQHMSTATKASPSKQHIASPMIQTPMGSKPFCTDSVKAPQHQSHHAIKRTDALSSYDTATENTHAGMSPDQAAGNVELRFVGPCSFYAKHVSAFLVPHQGNNPELYSVLLHLFHESGDIQTKVLVEPPKGAGFNIPRVLADDGYVHVVFDERSSSQTKNVYTTFESSAQTQTDDLKYNNDLAQTEKLNQRNTPNQVNEDSHCQDGNSYPDNMTSQSKTVPQSRPETYEDRSNNLYRDVDERFLDDGNDKQSSNGLLEMCTSLILREMYNRHHPDCYTTDWDRLSPRRSRHNTTTTPKQQTLRYSRDHLTSKPTKSNTKQQKPSQTEGRDDSVYCLREEQTDTQFSPTLHDESEDSLERADMNIFPNNVKNCSCNKKKHLAGRCPKKTEEIVKRKHKLANDFLKSRYIYLHNKERVPAQQRHVSASEDADSLMASNQDVDVIGYDQLQANEESKHAIKHKQVECDTTKTFKGKRRGKKSRQPVIMFSEKSSQGSSSSCSALDVPVCKESDRKKTKTKMSGLSSQPKLAVVCFDERSEDGETSQEIIRDSSSERNSNAYHRSGSTNDMAKSSVNLRRFIKHSPHSRSLTKEDKQFQHHKQAQKENKDNAPRKEPNMCTNQSKTTRPYNHEGSSRISHSQVRENICYSTKTNKDNSQYKYVVKSSDDEIYVQRRKQNNNTHSSSYVTMNNRPVEETNVMSISSTSSEGTNTELNSAQPSPTINKTPQRNYKQDSTRESPSDDDIPTNPQKLKSDQAYLSTTNTAHITHLSSDSGTLQKEHLSMERPQPIHHEQYAQNCNQRFGEVGQQQGHIYHQPTPRHHHNMAQPPQTHSYGGRSMRSVEAIHSVCSDFSATSSRRQRVRFSDCVTELCSNASNNKLASSRHLNPTDIDDMVPSCPGDYLASRSESMQRKDAFSFVNKHDGHQIQQVRTRRHDLKDMTLQNRAEYQQHCDYPKSFTRTQDPELDDPPRSSHLNDPRLVYNTKPFRDSKLTIGPLSSRSNNAQDISTSSSSWNPQIAQNGRSTTIKGHKSADRTDSGYSTPTTRQTGDVTEASELSDWDKAIQKKLNRRLKHFV